MIVRPVFSVARERKGCLLLQRMRFLAVAQKMAEESEEQITMKWPDILVVVLYFIFVLAVGLFVSIPLFFFYFHACSRLRLKNMW